MRASGRFRWQERSCSRQLRRLSRSIRRRPRVWERHAGFVDELDGVGFCPFASGLIDGRGPCGSLEGALGRRVTGKHGGDLLHGRRRSSARWRCGPPERPLLEQTALRSIAARASSGLVSHVWLRVSHSLGPRAPNLSRKASNSSRIAPHRDPYHASVRPGPRHPYRTRLSAPDLQRCDPCPTSPAPGRPIRHRQRRR